MKTNDKNCGPCGRGHQQNHAEHHHANREHTDHSHNHHHAHQEQSASLTTLNPQSGQLLTTLKVKNMDCADEIKAINEALKFDGIFKVQANLMSSTVQILHLPEISQEKLKAKIETTIVKVIESSSSAEQGLFHNNKNRIWTVIAAGLFLVCGLVIEWFFSNLNPFRISFYLFTIVLGGSLVFPKAWGSLKRKSLDMNVLMTVAAIGALAIREYAEAAAVVFLFAFSELLESLSVQRARRAISELLNVAPSTAAVIGEDARVQNVAVETVQLGQVIRVMAGELIALDGVVKMGTSSVNQAALTGESIPLEKNPGDEVFAGTINQDGTLDIEVTKIFKETKISQVIRMVEEAQSQKAQSQKFVDRFAEIYTPAVMLLAALTCVLPPLVLGLSWQEWFYKSLVLLVIACPCALVISTPVAVVSGITALARKGVLVKGGAVLEALATIKAIALDKTGTLTEGAPQIRKIVSVSSISEKEILKIAASLETHSTHPLAKAVLQAAQEEKIEIFEINDFKNLSGKGIEASISDHRYLLANHRYVHELGICSSDLEMTLQELEEQAYSVIIVGHKPHENCEGEVLGIIALGDKIRENVQETLKKIRQENVEHIIVLSGDNNKTAQAVAKSVQIAEVYGDLLPADKLTKIESLMRKYQNVAMVGDGINDAPAMAKASIGIAMGLAGSDTAIETADMVLMKDDLSQVPSALRLGKRTLDIIKFNISFALITKALFLVLTFVGYTNLWIAVAADTGAALLVILNSMRLLKSK